MKDTLKQILVTVLFFLIVFLLIFIFADNGKNKNGKNYDAFAQCLTDKGAVFYGTESCGFCKQQKNFFGSSFRYITDVDCKDNINLCLEKGIEGYPTWLFGTSTRKVEGFDKNKTMQELSDITGCVLP